MSYPRTFGQEFRARPQSSSTVSTYDNQVKSRPMTEEERKWLNSLPPVKPIEVYKAPVKGKLARKAAAYAW